ncbi:MAG: hypothetical protein H0W88_11705 [Parachlamydiaceae bacterium]|nr:hypothetical protein [Parachlamydiaceae bacterium]
MEINIFNSFKETSFSGIKESVSKFVGNNKKIYFCVLGTFALISIIYVVRVVRNLSDHKVKPIDNDNKDKIGPSLDSKEQKSTNTTRVTTDDAKSKGVADSKAKRKESESDEYEYDPNEEIEAVFVKPVGLNGILKTPKKNIAETPIKKFRFDATVTKDSETQNSTAKKKKVARKATPRKSIRIKPSKQETQSKKNELNELQNQPAKEPTTHVTQDKPVASAHSKIQSKIKNIELKSAVSNILSKIKDFQDLKKEDMDLLFGESCKLINGLKIKSLAYPEGIIGSEEATNRYRKNFRFKNIGCPEYTAVAVNGKKPVDGTTEDFLHANELEIEGYKFIVGQYPVHKDLFWECVKDNVNPIVDISSYNEMPEGTEEYYPRGSFAVRYSTSVEAFITSHNHSGSIHSSMLSVNNKTKEIIFPRWKSHEGLDLSDLKELVQYIHKNYPQNSSSYPFIMTAAGGGRAGTLATCLVLSNLIDKDQIKTVDKLKEKIIEVILEGRLQRGIDFVQSLDQLKTIWAFSVAYFNKKIGVA